MYTAALEKRSSVVLIFFLRSKKKAVLDCLDWLRGMLRRWFEDDGREDAGEAVDGWFKDVEDGSESMREDGGELRGVLDCDARDE